MLEKNNVVKEMLFQMNELIYKSSELHAFLIKSILLILKI
ncbi:hypothetical protein LT318_00459 [Spiroplasma sp. JKS002670]|nr:hypothetical protein [Spiroplasma sp. JKS002670]